MNEKILILEKDPALREAFSAAFEEKGVTPVVSADKEAVLRICDTFAPDGAVLDLGPYSLSGCSLCAILKKRFHRLRLILLTGDFDGNAASGPGISEADLMLARDISPRELAGEALRCIDQSREPEAKEEEEESLVCGPIRIDLASQRLYKNGVQVEMTRQELSLLHVLMEHAGTALSRSELLELAWGSDYYGHKTVDVHIRRLRRKIEDSPSHPRLIQTIWGFGYRFCKS